MRLSVAAGVRRFGSRLASSDRAVANARAASVELSRLRVEREEIELYLQHRLAPTSVPAARLAARTVRAAT